MQKSQLKMINFKRNKGYPMHNLSNKGLKGTFVNRHAATMKGNLKFRLQSLKY